MRFLLDTNIAIYLDPTSSREMGISGTDAVRLHESCQRAGIGLYVHPVSGHDFARDRNSERRELRERCIKKFPILVEPPDISAETQAVIGTPAPYSNDWVDHHLIEAAYRCCAHLLVTEDLGIHRKARRLGLTNVASIKEALNVVKRLFPRDVELPPAVQMSKVYSLDRTDPIFNSFREDYPDFDIWLDAISQQHRDAWVIKRGSGLAGLAIYKHEDGREIGEAGPVLKLCSFKVAEAHRGKAYGELLMRSAFVYANENGMKWIYLTVFEEKQAFLISFLEDIGFAPRNDMSTNGETFYAKPIGHLDGLPDYSDPVTYLQHYGPFSFKRETVAPFIVPIRPHYHRVLFPDAESTEDLLPGEQYYGNALRKAYLCNASIRKIRQGDILFFYRSCGVANVQVVGVVEKVYVSSDPGEIAGRVGKRSVYTHADIVELTRKGEVLVLLFMAVKARGVSLSLRAMKDHRVLKAHPQSIQSLNREHLSWLLTQLSL